MNAMISFLLGGATVGLGMFFYNYSKNKGFKFPIPFKSNKAKEEIQGNINFNDVVAWFKTLDLHQGIDMPFIADATNPAFKKLLDLSQHAVVIPTGKKALYLGVFNAAKEEIITGKLIIADGFDEKTNEILGKEALVVLN